MIADDLKKSIKVFKKVLTDPRVYGKLVEDASIASIVNFFYAKDKGIPEVILLIISVLGIIIGVILDERMYDDINNS